jgi:glyoxylase I family protein
MTERPFEISQIDHVVIRVRDIQSMLRFYLDVVGCTVEREIESIGLYQLRAGASLIDLVDAFGELGVKGGEPPQGKGGNMDHLCVRVSPWDASSIQAYLTHVGAEPGNVEQRNGAEGVGPSIYFNDPEGNTIELKGPAD